MLDALDADRVHLVGLGLGGWAAAEMATMNQNRLVTLTLVGAAGLKPRVGEIHDPMLAGFIDYVWLAPVLDSALDALLRGVAPDRDLLRDLLDEGVEPRPVRHPHDVQPSRHGTARQPP
jgi:pimeloyl-ACP methyl ester carboxylesterase